MVGGILSRSSVKLSAIMLCVKQSSKFTRGSKSGSNCLHSQALVCRRPPVQPFLYFISHTLRLWSGVTISTPRPRRHLSAKPYFARLKRGGDVQAERGAPRRSTITAGGLCLVYPSARNSTQQKGKCFLTLSWRQQLLSAIFQLLSKAWRCGSLLFLWSFFSFKERPYHWYL